MISGYVRDAETGEPVMGANISIDTIRAFKSTDPFGYYNLTIPTGRHTIHISSAGMKDTRRQLMVYGDGNFNIELEEFIASLRTVIVSAEKTSNTRDVEMGVSKLKIQTIKQVPVVFGEVDVLKVLLTLPVLPLSVKGVMDLMCAGVLLIRTWFYIMVRRYTTQSPFRFLGVRR